MDLEDHLSPIPLLRARAPSTSPGCSTPCPNSNPAREGAATASLGSLGQGLPTLTVKDFFLTSNLNLLSFSLKPLPLVLSLHALVKSPSPALSQPHQVLAAALRTPCSLLFSRPTHPSSRPLLTADGLQPSDHCCGLLWPRSNRPMSPEGMWPMEDSHQGRDAPKGLKPMDDPCQSGSAACGGQAAVGTSMRDCSLQTIIRCIPPPSSC